MCKGWLKAKRQCSVRTAEGYEAIRNRLLGYLGNIELKKITVHAADTVIAELKPLQGDKLSGWTRWKILRGCKAKFNKAVKWEWISRNPFKDVEAPKGLSVRPWHYLTPIEYKRLLDATPSLKWKAAWALAYTAGLRFGELFNLRWSDIYFENKELTVQNHAPTAEMPPFKVKNGKPRTIPLPKATIEILQQLQRQARLRTPYVLLTERQYQNAVDRWQKCHEHKRRWQNSYMANNTLTNFKRHVEAAEIEPNGVLCLHTLRKCAGKNWSKVVDPKTLQELMGHASISTTMKFYAKVTEDDKQKAADAIDGLLAKSDANVTPTANIRAS